MLKKSCSILMVFIVFVCFLNSFSIAADTEAVDKVRSAARVSGTLTDSDVRVIDQFINDSLYEMLDAIDYAEMVDVRARLSLRNGQGKPSKYSMAFNSSLKKNLQAITREIESWDNGDRKTQIRINLVILVAETKSLDMIDYGLGMVDNENTLIRYWAVKCVASENIAAQLNSTISGDEEIARKIVTRIQSHLPNETHAEVLNLIATFAGQLNIPEAAGLLKSVADIRLKAYRNWSVDYELMDANLLAQLHKKIDAAGIGKESPLIARKFAQLYSYVIQRYILGREVLSPACKERLASVMAQIENDSISKILGRKQDVIKRAIEKNDSAQLQREHNSLLGTNTRAGRLSSELKFDYGKDTSGRPINAPKKLPGPPVVETEETLQDSE